MRHLKSGIAHEVLYNSAAPGRASFCQRQNDGSAVAHCPSVGQCPPYWRKELGVAKTE